MGWPRQGVGILQPGHDLASDNVEGKGHKTRSTRPIDAKLQKKLCL